jgi:hypothetical protein
MYELEIRDLVRAVAVLHAAWAGLHTLKSPEEIIPVGDDGVLNAAKNLRVVAGAFGSMSTAMPVERLIATIESREPIKFGYMQMLLEQIVPRLADDLVGRKVFVLAPQDEGYYVQATPLFGSAMSSQFPSVVYDMEESGKCRALGRNTASVFHAIRCLEAGIRALSRCLKIPDPTRSGGRNWGAMLKTLKDGIDSKWPVNSARLAGDGEFFDNAYAALAAMQNPWRNATMHLDHKYTEEEARHVFDVVNGFMRKVAGRMDESGEPFA